jgi:hypothetical protein
MNQVFRAKAKMHKFINMAFYFVFFFIGFLVGGGKIEKISSIFNYFFN